MDIRYTFDGAYSGGLPEANLGLVQAWSGDTLLPTSTFRRAGMRPCCATRGRPRLLLRTRWGV